MAWDFPRSGRRRPAKDGIAAKRRSGAIGEQWWSKRFVSVLEAITGASRLQRGRSYARSGQVSALVVAPGVVTASVQGSRARPYSVRIEWKALTDAQWGAAQDALSSRALFAAALLAGELPHELEALFLELGTPLFPARSGDLSTSCSCPDWANPCKHVAATYYLLAERFDADPFAILAWRGRDRDALVDGLRERRTAAAEAVVDAAPSAPVAPPLALEGFWTAEPAALQLRFRPDLPGVPEELIRQRGPLASGAKDLAPSLAEACAGIAAVARVRALE